MIGAAVAGAVTGFRGDGVAGIDRVPKPLEPLPGVVVGLEGSSVTF